MASGRKIVDILILLCWLSVMSTSPAVAADAGIRVTAIDAGGQTTTLPLYSGYHALVIGCSTYAPGWPVLGDRTAHTREIAAMLTDMGWSVDHVTNPDGQTLRRVLRQLVFNQGRDRERAILIWFAGHGASLPEADGMRLGYLVPVDAPDPGVDPMGFAEKALSMREVETVARQLLARHVLMVLDVSASGELFLMEQPRPDDRLRESVAAPVRQIIIGDPTGTPPAGGPALKDLFLRAILKGAADRNGDGYVTGKELGDHIAAKRAPTDAARDRYFGRIDSRNPDQGDFVFVVPAAETDAAAAPEKKQKTAPQAMPKEITNSLGMTFAYIPPGRFMMGSPASEPGREADERLHPVTLTAGFRIQTTEVTQAQWQAVMGTHPSGFSQCGGECPVENVSWDEVQAFIQRLNQQDPGSRYRLPSEAEWEYACRAGSDTAIYTGDMPILGQRNAPALNAIAWYGGNSCAAYPGARPCGQWKQRQINCENCGPHAVGLKQPNAWGLYDMLGNVYEWCQDYFANYPDSMITDPTGPIQGTRRIARGGAWDYHAKTCRSANRNHFFPGYRSDYVGFRLVLMPAKPAAGGLAPAVVDDAKP